MTWQDQVYAGYQCLKEGIRGARVCLADISTDKPNVFYELGAAHMLDRDVVMVCDTSKCTDKLPFDIGHRTVLLYQPQCPSDFDRLRDQITEKLKALMQRDQDIQMIANQPFAITHDGLLPMELALLVIVAEEDHAQGYHSLVSTMSKSGYTKIAARIALQQLLSRQLVQKVQIDDRDGVYDGYAATDEGLQLLRLNMDKIRLQRTEPRPAPPAEPAPGADDEPPF